jgi:predicted transcriptional regulator
LTAAEPALPDRPDEEESDAMTLPNELSWSDAMRRAHQAVTLSEALYDEIDQSEGRSNLDVEKHLRRAEVKASHAQAWVAIAQALGTQSDRY